MITNIQNTKWTYVGPGEGKGQIHRVIDYVNDAVTNNGLVVTISEFHPARPIWSFYGRWQDFLHLFRRC